MKYFKHIKHTIGILTGVATYGFLGFIPALGWVIAGAAAGLGFKRNPKLAFMSGIVSAVLGAIASTYVLIYIGVFSGSALALNILLTWFLLIWHLAGVLFCGLGALLSSSYDLIARHPLIYPIKSLIKEEAHTYVVCGNCGSGNREGKSICISCETNIT